jgi:hypothetical protein
MDAGWTMIVGLGLLLWWIASIIHQIPPRWWNYVTQYDLFRLLPQWHFFAPRPGRRDNHLVIRDIVDGQLGEWREIDVGEAPLTSRWLWNPSRFRQKALADLTNGLIKARRLYTENQFGDRSERLSLPYLGLLAWVNSQPAASQPCLRQFAIVASSGHKLDRMLHIVYVSDAHRILEDDDAS